MELKEIVEKLVGPIQPIGESSADEKRFENLKVMCNLVEDLVASINDVAILHSNAHEHSRKRAGAFAMKFRTRRLGITE